MLSRNEMSHPRRNRGGGPKNSADRCEGCEHAVESGSTSSQGKLKSDGASGGRKENLEINPLSDNRRVLLAITVEIEDGCVEHIQLKEGDSAEAVALKFCQDHALPEQFVAPLAEHIISNVISASREGNDDIFHSQDEHLSHDENSTALRGGAPHSPAASGSDDVVNSVLKRRVHGGDSAPVIAEASAMLARRDRRRSMDPPLMASQAVRLGGGQGCHVHRFRPREDQCHKPVTRMKTRRKIGRKKISDRLIAPTITSLAKTKSFGFKEKPRSLHPKPLSEPAKAVFMRLYTEHLRHENRTRMDLQRSKAFFEQTYAKKVGLSKKNWRLTRMRGKIAKQYRNYGELLYAEGLTKIQNHLKAVAEKKTHDEAMELAEVRAKPKISKRAKNVNRGEGKVWSRLTNSSKLREDQLQELRQEVRELKYMECTFKPRINLNWKYHAHSEQYGVLDYRNCFEQLFMDAEDRRRRQAEYMEWYPKGVTFQPCINRSKPCWEPMEDDWPSERCVFRRLLENAARTMEKKQILERLAHRPVDPCTGQELFKPLTGRKPLNNRNPVRLPIGDYLYRMRFALDRKLRNLHARDWQKKKELAERQYVGPTSQKLLQRLKQRGLKQVFDFLDDDKDGLVDLTTANFDRVNDDVVENLTRLMTWEGKGKKLNFEQFVNLMLVAEKKYHSGQQLHLGLKHKIHATQRTYTFQNEMDQLSRNLATKRRKYSTHNEWFKIISAEAAKRQQKVEEWRKARQTQEMAECTFKPELISTCRVKRVLAFSNCPEPVDDSAGGTIGETISSIIEKVQQEVHGFYFHDKREGAPELLEMPAPVSPTPSSRNMATKETGDMATSASSSTTGTKNVCCYCDSQKRRNRMSDSPKQSNPPPKSGMFFGLLGG